MKSLNFDQDNLLSYNGIIADTSPISLMFALVLLEEGEPMDPVESELNAIERTNNIKEFHKQAGITKTPRYYHYFKLQAMALNDAGYKRTKEHVFKHNEIILN